jgi:hypothetical protein
MKSLEMTSLQVGCCRSAAAVSFEIPPKKMGVYPELPIFIRGWWMAFFALAPSDFMVRKLTPL